MTTEEQKKAEELKKAEEAKKAEELKKAEEAKAEEAKKAEELKKAEDQTVTEEALLKAIESLEEFAKARKEVEEEDEEEEIREEEEEEKSFAGNFDENDTLEKAIEVSPFLEALVGETEVSISALGKEISGLKKSTSEFDGKQIEALKQVAEVMKSLTSKFDEMQKSFDERLKKIEETPARPIKSITKATAIEKSFTGKEGESDLATVPRRKIVDAIAKAVEDGKLKDSVLFGYEAEGSYPLTEDQTEIVKSYLK